MSDIFDKIAANIPPEKKRFVQKSMDLVLTIHDILRKKGMTQKDLAHKLGKSEAEISKWLTPTYNLSLRSIAKIEEALGESIMIPTKFLEEYEQESNTNEVLSPIKNTVVPNNFLPLKLDLKLGTEQQKSL